MLAMLSDAHATGQLTFFNNHAGLADKKTFKRFLAPLRHIDWVVYCKPPFAGPKQVLRYLSRYTHRVAISNRRLVASDDGGVSFRRWRRLVPLEGLSPRRPRALENHRSSRQLCPKLPWRIPWI